jgi:hypothetical protein
VSPLLRIRRGLGWLYVLTGLVQTALMGLAVAVSLGWLQVFLTGRQWSQAFYGQFLLLCVAGPMYLLLAFRKERVFIPAVYVDLIAGIPVFVVLLSGVLPLLARGGTRVLALLPGAFLLGYGAGLVSGRAYAVGPKAPF